MFQINLHRTFHSFIKVIKVILLFSKHQDQRTLLVTQCKGNILVSEVRYHTFLKFVYKQNKNCNIWLPWQTHRAVAASNIGITPPAVSQCKRMAHVAVGGELPYCE